jgi:hypothetical protein
VLPKSQWKNLLRTKQVALAFGAEAAKIPEGRYFDLDAVVLRSIWELTDKIKIEHVVGLLRLHGDIVLGAIGRAEHEAEPVWLAIAEHYDEHGQKAYNLAAGSLSDFADYRVSEARFTPARITLLNVNKLIADVRANAAKVGVDLDGVFFPAPDTEIYQAIMAEGRKVREDTIAKIRGIGELRQ